MMRAGFLWRRFSGGLRYSKEVLREGILPVSYLRCSTSGVYESAGVAGGSCATQFRLSAAKACCGRSGNSLALKQSGTLIFRCA